MNLDNPKILDLCTGSGAIGLTLKSLLPSSEVTLSDISKDALMVANKNKNELNLDVNIIESDLFKNIQGKFDIIISNPPYVMTNEPLPKDVLYEPHLALYSFPKGIDHIEEIFKNIKSHLNNKYLIALEINEKSETDIINLIKTYFEKNINYKFMKDLAGKTRYLFITNV